MLIIASSQKQARTYRIAAVWLLILSIILIYEAVNGLINRVILLRGMNWFWGVITVLTIGLIFLALAYAGMHEGYVVSRPIILDEHENVLYFPVTWLERVLMKKGKILSIYDIKKIYCKTFDYRHPRRTYKTIKIITYDGKKYLSSDRNPKDIDKFLRIIREKCPYVYIEEK